ncbi:MAG: insulinase family protein [Polyangiaceae bacterium]|nr:insulinase family protein [Polyangiaceae bacterium]
MSWHRPFLLASLVVASCRPAAPPPSPPTTPSTSAPPLPSASASASATPDEEFRRRPPPPGAEGVFQAPVPFDIKLSNQLRVLHLPTKGAPVVSMQVVIRRGAAAGAPGVAALLGPMLMQGTPSRDLFEISDALEELGARHRVTVDEDAILVSATVLKNDAERALMLLADAVQHPSFPAEELERIKARKVQALAAERDLPRVQLQRAVAELLYPERHAYRASQLLTPATVQGLRRGDLQRFHRDHVQPDSAALILAGDLPRARVEELAQRAFGKWRGRSAPAALAAAPQAPRGPSVLLVDLPDAPQTSVALCAVGAAYTSADHDDLMVLSTVLTRRLNANLRGRHAYTYGVSSQVAFRHGPGPFTAGGDVVREKTAEAVREILGEVALLRDEPVGHDELQEAKTILSALSGRFETAESTVTALTPLAIYGLGDDDFMTLRVRLQLVSRETLQKTARAYLTPARLRLALVGDAARIEAPVQALQLGPVEVRRSPPGPRSTAPPSTPDDAP